MLGINDDSAQPDFTNISPADDRSHSTGANEDSRYSIVPSPQISRSRCPSGPSYFSTCSTRGIESSPVSTRSPDFTPTRSVGSSARGRGFFFRTQSTNEISNRTEELEKLQSELLCMSSSDEERGNCYRWINAMCDHLRAEHNNFVGSPQGKYLFAGMTIVYGLLIGVEMQVSDDSVESLALWCFVDSFFLFVLIGETALRVRASGFRIIREEPATLFDVVLICLGILDTWVLQLARVSAREESDTMFTGELLNFMRFFRIVRAVRLLRLFRYFKELLWLAMGILGALKALFWSVVLMVLILYVGSVMATTWYNFAAIEDPDFVQDAIGDWFGCVGSSMLTFFQLLTLEGWPTIVRGSVEVEKFAWIFFVPFVLLANVSLLNAVAAVVVEKIFCIARNQEGQEVKRLEKTRSQTLRRVKSMCLAMDADVLSFISKETFMKALADPGVAKALRDLGLDCFEAQELFECLDVDGAGQLTVAEFSDGCLRAAGPAQSKHLLQVQDDILKSHKAIKFVLGELQTAEVRLLRQLSKVHGKRRKSTLKRRKMAAPEGCEVDNQGGDNRSQRRSSIRKWSDMFTRALNRATSITFNREVSTDSQDGDDARSQSRRSSRRLSVSFCRSSFRAKTFTAVPEETTTEGDDEIHCRPKRLPRLSLPVGFSLVRAKTKSDSMPETNTTKHGAQDSSQPRNRRGFLRLLSRSSSRVQTFSSIPETTATNYDDDSSTSMPETSTPNHECGDQSCRQKLSSRTLSLPVGRKAVGGNTLSLTLPCRPQHTPDSEEPEQAASKNAVPLDQELHDMQATEVCTSADADGCHALFVEDRAGDTQSKEALREGPNASIDGGGAVQPSMMTCTSMNVVDSLTASSSCDLYPGRPAASDASVLGDKDLSRTADSEIESQTAEDTIAAEVTPPCSNNQVFAAYMYEQEALESLLHSQLGELRRLNAYATEMNDLRRSRRPSGRALSSLVPLTGMQEGRQQIGRVQSDPKP